MTWSPSFHHTSFCPSVCLLRWACNFLLTFSPFHPLGRVSFYFALLIFLFLSLSLSSFSPTLKYAYTFLYKYNQWDCLPVASGYFYGTLGHGLLGQAASVFLRLPICPLTCTCWCSGSHAPRSPLLDHRWPLRINILVYFCLHPAGPHLPLSAALGYLKFPSFGNFPFMPSMTLLSCIFINHLSPSFPY